MSVQLQQTTGHFTIYTYNIRPDQNSIVPMSKVMMYPLHGVIHWYCCLQASQINNDVKRIQYFVVEFANIDEKNVLRG